MNKRAKAPNKKQTTGAIRIIAGKFRGRKLPVLMADGLRPTTDRVKETLFNWLMPYINQSNCLDCFAGSGGLGFEAASRGANKVTLIEFNKQAATQILRNIKNISANNIEVINTDALAFLTQSATPYDIVFIDPPFRKNMANTVISLLQQGWLKDQALVYVETESESDHLEVPSCWKTIKEKKAGQVIYRLYQVSLPKNS